MASRLDARSPGDKDTSAPSRKGPGRRVLILIVFFAVFTTIHLLLQNFVSEEITTPAPRYKLHRNMTVQPGVRLRESVPTPGSVSPLPNWKFIVKELQQIRVEIATPAPRYQLHRNMTVQPAEVVPKPGSGSPHPTWTFNAKALQEIRKSTARLHPDVFLKGSLLGPWKEKLPPTCNVTTRSNNTKTCPSQHNIGQYRTCAVVGNSGILLGSDCGPDIDSKDYIIRIDLPAVQGFEKDVGRRTNMTVLNMSTPNRLETSSQLKNRSQDVYESRLKYINGTVLVADRLSVDKLRRAFLKYRQSFVLLISAERLKRGSGVGSATSRISSKRSVGAPSTGRLTVLMASTFCDQLYLYGFYPFKRDEKKRPIPYHYYPGDSVGPIFQAGKHHMSHEYNLYKELQKRGVLKLHVGKCGKQ